MSSGISIKEVQRFFEYLKQSKTNNEMTILITNDMCKELQFIVENLCKYIDLLEDRKDKAIKYLKNDYLDITDVWLKDNLLDILEGESND